MGVAERIKELVEERGVTYTFISVKTGIPVNSISRTFLGKRRLPADEMVAICNAIGVDLPELNVSTQTARTKDTSQDSA